MRKITFLLVLILCMTSNHVYGRQLSATEAQSIALNHLRENNRLNATGATPQLDLALTAKSKSMDVDYYVFNMSEDKGYIIISGDDRASAVLAYSDEGTFDINSIPDGLQYWLDVYSQEMQYLRDNPNAPKAYNRSQLSSSVRPLLTCNWNQGEPYNNLCPTYSDNGTTKRAVTGCVATAAAQIMYYHRWPVTGTGSHSYVCNVNKTGEQTLSADFGSTTYDWDNMLDSYDGHVSCGRVMRHELWKLEWRTDLCHDGSSEKLFRLQQRHERLQERKHTHRPMGADHQDRDRQFPTCALCRIHSNGRTRFCV